MFKNKKYKTTYLIILLIAFFIGCSPKSNYKLLSTLFDGVADPNKVDSIAKVKKSSDSLKTIKVASKTSSKIVHPPYQDNGCANCHDKVSKSALNLPQPALCYSCHEDFSKKFTWVHGPAAAGGCTKCHNPHSSDYKKLLRKEGQDLCFSCHDSKDVLKNEIHKEIGETKCTECHNPHGGNDKLILR
jgi:predicted CXXCH cytochrome family protein